MLNFYNQTSVRNLKGHFYVTIPNITSLSGALLRNPVVTCYIDFEIQLLAFCFSFVSFFVLFFVCFLLNPAEVKRDLFYTCTS